MHLTMDYIKNQKENGIFERKAVCKTSKQFSHLGEKEALKETIKEFKKTIASELLAFANSDGGTLVFGISDRNENVHPSEIQGVYSTMNSRWNNAQKPYMNMTEKEKIVLESKLDDFLKIPNTHCFPNIDCVIEEVEITTDDGEKDIIIFYHVKKSEGKLHLSTDDKLYIRTADSSMLLKGQAMIEKLNSISSSSDPKTFEYDFCDLCTMEDMDLDLFEEFKKISGYLLDLESYLLVKNLATEENGRLRIRNAGVLLFSKYPERWITKGMIRVMPVDGIVEELGTKSNKRQVKIKGPLAKQIRDATEEIEKFIGDKRLDSNKKIFSSDLEYPKDAILEAVVNAVTHRDYSFGGADINIKIFKDRIEFISPGSLHFKVDKQRLLDLETAEDLSKVRIARFSRNPLIAAAMEEFEFVKEWGEGIKRIHTLMREEKMESPIFGFEDLQVILTFKNKYLEKFIEEVVINIQESWKGYPKDKKIDFFKKYNLELSETIKMEREKFSDLNIDKKEILLFTIYKKELRLQELIVFLGVSESTARRKIKEMVQEGLLKTIADSDNDPNKHYLLT